MGTDWTPERDAKLVARLEHLNGLLSPGALDRTFPLSVDDVADLRAAWADAEAALTMARARAAAAAEERDAALARAERSERWRDETYRDGRWIELKVSSDDAESRAQLLKAELASYAEVQVDGRTLAEWRSVGVTEPWKRRMTRADVEAALARADRVRVDGGIVDVYHSNVSDEDACVVGWPTVVALVGDLVCAVLGVPDAE